MAPSRVGEAGLWDAGPAVHHRGGDHRTHAQELQENTRRMMVVAVVLGEARALSPIQVGTRPAGAQLALASAVWLDFNFLESLAQCFRASCGLFGLLLVPCLHWWGLALAHGWWTLGGTLDPSESAWGPDCVAGTAQLPS